MDTSIVLLIALLGCCDPASATRFLNNKEATSFLSMKRVKRSSYCLIESFCEMNYPTCASGSGREVIRQDKCNGVSCSFGEKCDIQTSYKVCPSHISGVQCLTEETTMRATLIIAMLGLSLVVILMVVVTILIVHICKRKSKIFPQQEPLVKDNEQPSISNSRTVLQPANTSFRGCTNNLGIDVFQSFECPPN
ncbi:hypothetical protein ACJMK2_010934 [Sinanodonta woodiana]|uniref:Uncharacterized protein n=1 Tax=Sinanodonta woodiana TaxID=1069815 RepID=A0ABD3V388_SINWO